MIKRHTLCSYQFKHCCSALVSDGMKGGKSRSTNVHGVRRIQSLFLCIQEQRRLEHLFAQ